MVVGVRLYRDALVRVLREEPGVRLAGEASGAGDALTTIARAAADVVLLDLGIDGALDVLRSVRTRERPPRVIALGFSGNGDDALTVAEAGVNGYIGVDQPVSDVARAIRSVMRGEVPCDGLVAAALLRRVQAIARLEGERTGPLALLTRSERRILELVARGLSNKQIASELVISVPTVKSHIHAILRKLGVEHRAAAADVLRRAYGGSLASRPG